MKNPQPLVSVVVVDYKKNNPLLTQCLDHVAKQSYQNFEIILLTDYPVNVNYPKLKKKSYGKYVGPATKRDDGANLAKGQIVAFLDEDAYPSRDWLKEIVRALKDSSVSAVGGPGMTPPGSPWQEELSGWFSASPVGGGPFTYRFLPGREMDVDDYPSMNLAVRRQEFLKVGGFDSNFWPGEDTKLCLDLVHKLHKRILYNPKAIVYHHRRPLWRPHFRQNGNYCVHRGYFARILPETSFRLEYFGPSFLFLGSVFFLIFHNNPLFALVDSTVAVVLTIYAVSVVLNGLWVAQKSGSILYGAVSVPLTVATHLWYGVKFIQGFLSPKKIENSNQ